MKIQERFQAYYTHTEATLERQVVNPDYKLDRPFFEETENYRYKRYPYFRDLMGFSDYRDKSVLEIGVGQGVDHKQFAQHGTRTFGIDITPRHLKMTQERLRNYHLKSRLALADGGVLPFSDRVFDLVYSCGVLFLLPDLKQAISEIFRVLKPGGEVVALFYNAASFVRVVQGIIYSGIVKGELRFLSDHTLGDWYAGDGFGYPPVRYVTRRELKHLFRQFVIFRIDATELFKEQVPIVGKFLLSNRLLKLYAAYWGYYLTVRAQKPEEDPGDL